MMHEELMKKVKEAKSVEELLALAKENNYPMDEEGAKEIFCQLHTEGELDDDELGSVSGGGCACYTKVNGQKYVIVTPNLDCFTDRFEIGFKVTRSFDGGGRVSEKYTFYNQDNIGLRDFWRTGQFREHKCGNCKYLGFKVATGYCKLS